LGNASAFNDSAKTLSPAGIPSRSSAAAAGETERLHTGSLQAAIPNSGIICQRLQSSLAALSLKKATVE
jgi:hypothetical protein